MPAPATDQTFPAQLGRYRLLKRLGLGPTAEVFMAELDGPGGFQRRVALKVLLPGPNGDAEMVRMFRDEARLGGRFTHPNLVQVYESGEAEGRHFLAMEYARGLSLRSLIQQLRIKQARMPDAIAAAVGSQSAAALAAVHALTDEEGLPLHIVHRDLTPDNIFLTVVGVTKVLDFGIALSEGRLVQTQVGVVRGRPAYLSPEQAAGKPVTDRTDVFTLATSLWEALTTEPRFEVSSLAEAHDRLNAVPPPDIRSARPDLDDQLASLLMSALEPDPQLRPSAAALQVGFDALRRSFGQTNAQTAITGFLSGAIPSTPLTGSASLAVGPPPAPPSSARPGSPLGPESLPEWPVPASHLEPAPPTSEPEALELDDYRARPPVASPASPAPDPEPPHRPAPSTAPRAAPRSSAQPTSALPGPNELSVWIIVGAGIFAFLAGAAVASRYSSAVAARFATLGGIGAPPVEKVPDAVDAAPPEVPVPAAPIRRTISLASTPPGAAVQWDGADLGRVTPTTLEGIGAGTHRWVFTLDGYERVEGRFDPTLNAGSISVSLVAETPVHLEVHPPEAIVTCDGSALTVDAGVALLARGEHRLRAELARFVPIEQSFTVDDQHPSWSATLVPAAYLTIESTPAGGVVSLDGHALSVVTPVTDLAVAAGHPHQVEVTHETERASRRVPKLAAGKEATLSLKLVDPDLVAQNARRARLQARLRVLEAEKSRLESADGDFILHSAAEVRAAGQRERRIDILDHQIDALNQELADLEE